jgi:replication initiation and membrane attachment protein
MGIDCLSLYSVLIALEDGQTYPFKKLLDSLNFNNLKLVNKAFNKLEGLGLVKAYYSESKGHLYEVLQPLSFCDFFENEMFTSLLETQIGESEIKKLQPVHKKPVGYKEVTKKFSDIFETSATTIASTINQFTKPQINVENDDFNYTLFKMLFDGSVLNEEVLDDENFKARILRISYTYKLNEEEMRDVLVRTIDIDKNLEYASISKNARNAFQNKYKTTGPKIVTKVEDNFLPSSIDDRWREIIDKVENMQIADTLQSVSGMKPAVSEIKMFDQLLASSQFSIGVINMMILRVNATNNGVLPGFNYFEKIANTWARAKIKTSYDVLKYFETESQKKNKEKPATTRNKKVKAVPDWYEQYTSQLDGKTVKQEEMSEAEHEELSNLVKDIVG